MSLKTLSWALYEDDVTNVVEFAVLAILADATPEGLPDLTLVESRRGLISQRIGYGVIHVDAAVDSLYDRGLIIPAPPVLTDSTESPSRRKTLSVAARLSVFARNAYRCVSCGSEDNLSVDHIVPVSKGGTDHPDNLQTLCRSCNSRKGNRTDGSTSPS